MFIRKEYVTTKYFRTSKLGIEHSYTRTKTLAIFSCDNCDEIFKRELKKVSSKRLSNNFFHCCSLCDSKKFAQKKGIERKKIWDLPASVELPVGKY
jgi:hypothetical protein